MKLQTGSDSAGTIYDASNFLTGYLVSDVNGGNIEDLRVIAITFNVSN